MYRFFKLILVTLIVTHFTPIQNQCQASDEKVTKGEFDFGHQLGHLYDQVHEATPLSHGTLDAGIGLQWYQEESLHITKSSRTLYKIPLYLGFGLAPNVTGQLIFDLLHDSTITGRFRNSGGDLRMYAKIALWQTPSFDFSLHVGMNLPNANDVNQDQGRFTFKESSGLAGPGTDESDNLLSLLLTHKWNETVFHLNGGLGVFGDPTSNGSQADMILYGCKLEQQWNQFIFNISLSGFKGILSTTNQDHYSLIRSGFKILLEDASLAIQASKGLTPYSDDFEMALLHNHLFSF